jgi:hypothetical protein
MRNLILVAAPFLVLCAAGLLRILTHPVSAAEYSPDWTVTRSIAPNHQLQPDDLAIPGSFAATLRLLLDDRSFSGAHLQGRARRQGESVGFSDFDRRPDLSAAAHAQVYFYVSKEDSTPIGGWTEGASVIPCFFRTAQRGTPPKQAPACINTPLRILAIHKAQASSESSWLAIEVPASLQCAFVEFALAEKRILYQVSSEIAARVCSGPLTPANTPSTARTGPARTTPPHPPRLAHCRPAPARSPAPATCRCGYNGSSPSR